MDRVTQNNLRTVASILRAVSIEDPQKILDCHEMARTIEGWLQEEPEESVDEPPDVRRKS